MEFISTFCGFIYEVGHDIRGESMLIMSIFVMTFFNKLFLISKFYRPVQKRFLSKSM